MASQESGSILQTLVTQLHELATEWQSLGVFLGQDPNSFRTITMTYPTSAPLTHLTEVLNIWIKNTSAPGPYWEELAEAVEKLTLAEAQRLAAIFRQYCQIPGPTPIAPLTPAWIIRVQIAKIESEFPVDDEDQFLQFKLLSKAFFDSSVEIDAIDNADAITVILEMLKERFSQRIRDILHDMFTYLQLEHLLNTDVKHSNDVTATPQLSTTEYLYAKCIIKIARSLEKDDINKIINSLTGIYADSSSNLPLDTTSGVKLIYAMDCARIVTPTHVARLHRILSRIEKEELVRELESYLTQTHQEPVSQIVFPSVLSPGMEIEINPIIPSKDVDRIRNYLDKQKENIDVVSSLISQLNEYQRMLTDAQGRITELMKEKVLASSTEAFEEKLETQRERYEKEIKFLQQQNQSRAPCYPISPQVKTNRGYALIINNFRFTNASSVSSRSFPMRHASEKDEFNLIQVLGTRLGYQPVVFCNVDCHNTTTNIKRYANLATEEHDSFVCFVLSYGQNGHFYSSDSYLMNAFRDIVPLLDTPNLREKPKMVFVHSILPSVGEEDLPVSIQPPDTKDILVACTTSPPQTKHDKFGSVYIKCLFERLLRNCTTTDLVTILGMVGKEIAESSPQTHQFVMTTLTQRMSFFGNMKMETPDSDEDHSSS